MYGKTPLAAAAPSTDLTWYRIDAGGTSIDAVPALRRTVRSTPRVFGPMRHARVNAASTTSGSSPGPTTGRLGVAEGEGVGLATGIDGPTADGTALGPATAPLEPVPPRATSAQPLNPSSAMLATTEIRITATSESIDHSSPTWRREPEALTVDRGRAGASATRMGGAERMIGPAVIGEGEPRRHDRHGPEADTRQAAHAWTPHVGHGVT